MNKNDDLRIFAIIAVDRIIAMRLPWQKIWPPEALKQFVDALAEAFEYGILLGMKTIVFVSIHPLNIVSGYHADIVAGYHANPRRLLLLGATDRSVGYISRLPA